MILIIKFNETESVFEFPSDIHIRTVAWYVARHFGLDQKLNSANFTLYDNEKGEIIDGDLMLSDSGLKDNHRVTVGQLTGEEL